MKKLTMSLGLMLLLTGFQANAGNGKEGGFAYKKSITLLEAAKESALSWLAQAKEKCVNDILAEEGLAPVRIPRLKQAIKNLKMSFQKTKRGINPDGDSLPLMFSYGKDENGIEFIEALEPYFQAYMSNAYARLRQIELMDWTIPQPVHYSGVQSDRMRQDQMVYEGSLVLFEVEGLLLHEASHFFDYSEVDAEKFESVIMKIKNTSCK